MGEREVSGVMGGLHGSARSASTLDLEIRNNAVGVAVAVAVAGE